MRNEYVQQRLLQWAAWFNAGGCHSVGAWPRKNILHPSWMPPSGGPHGATPVKVRADGQERDTHRCIGLLTDKLICALVVHYCKRWPMDQQAHALGCTPNAVSGRVARAHSVLASVMQRH